MRARTARRKGGDNCCCSHWPLLVLLCSTPTQIDFVCHDAEPYAGAGASADSHDIYEFVKKQGRFLGTRRTGVSVVSYLPFHALIGVACWDVAP